MLIVLEEVADAVAPTGGDAVVLDEVDDVFLFCDALCHDDETLHPFFGPEDGLLNHLVSFHLILSTHRGRYFKDRHK